MKHLERLRGDLWLRKRSTFFGYIWQNITFSLYFSKIFWESLTTPVETHHVIIFIVLFIWFLKAKISFQPLLDNKYKKKQKTHFLISKLAEVTLPKNAI